MLIVYEKEENFFEKLRTITEKLTTKLFVSRVRNIDENGVLSPTILVQAVIGDDVYMVKYAGDLPKFQIIPTFDNILNNPTKEAAEKEYNDAYIAFEKKIEEEYNKMVTLLKTIGYTNIENAVIS